MKRLTNIVQRGCLYSVIIAFVVYALLGISGITASGMHWTRFLLLVVYGIIISVAEWLGDTLPIKRALQLLVNFSINLVSYIGVFLFVDAENGFNIGRFFVFVSIFVIVYALILFVANLIKRLPFFDKANEEVSAPKAEKPVYQPRYSDEV